ncbi:hypothetical protein Lalb_Chr07g0184561 [Lupinus albus]|uniref:Autophagy-related protein 13 N-terminal domain-containing protein n=1 Tax=Lupinus albus TaxID=3870 RepID=A0A6A4Q7T8_LUPAL|nr:hypothetical protein Lalb_Chr07g0184561 [Lupinus albus]
MTHKAMTSSHGNAHSEGAKMEQIITEFFAKSLHIILESRALFMSSRNSLGDQVVSSPSSSSSSTSSVRPRDKWFNLALRECPAALENIDLWRQSNLEPIVIDVVLVQRPVDWDPASFSPKRVISRSSSMKERYPFSLNSNQEELGIETKSENIIERWVLQYESRKTRDSNSNSRRSSNISLHTLYKKSTLLLRSLYSTVRLLPAHKIFRELNSSAQIHPFTLVHRVSSFVEPFTRKQETKMLKFGFTPVDTASGRLCLSVMYLPSASDVSSEPTTPMSPQVINDYVGSPLADPLRRFPLTPVTGLQSYGSPSSLPFSRRHSWSYDHFRTSPPSITCSPSPTYSESQTSVSTANSRHFPPASLPPHPTDLSLIQKKNTGFGECYPSPSYSMYNSGSLPSRTLLRTESAPVRILASEVANSPAYPNKHYLPPSPPLRGSRCASKTDRCMSMQTSATAEKLFSLGKDESRKYSGVKTSANSSPQISFSRSTSRSYQDDFDDPDFSCPFDIDDDDMTDPGSRAESFDHGHLADAVEAGGYFPIRKSHDASVGVLVHLLKKAPPLRQDLSTSENLSQGLHPQILKNNIEEPNQIPEAPMPVSMMSSGLIATRKTTADALEEFHSYREIKNLLLTRGSKNQM